MREGWRDITGYNNYPVYQVSTLGRVISFTRSGSRVLKPFQKHGYLYVHLYRDGKRKNFRVHRLVAEAFILNPDNLPEVNHKDEDKTNNCVENLEWTTPKGNANYGDRNRAISAKVKKAVVRMDSRTGKDLEVYDSVTEAASQIGGANAAHISECCKGRRKTSGGYEWRYLHEP